MLRRHLWGVLLATTACGPSVVFAPARPAAVEVEPAPAPEPVAPPVSGEVVVRSNAWLHAKPDGTPRFRIRALDAPVAAHHVRRFEVVEDRGAWVGVRAGRGAGYPRQTCVDGHGVLRQLGLTLWVRRTDLVPVTVRTVELPLPQGTSVTVRPGTPIGSARADGWRHVATRDASFYAPVPTDAIDWSFEQWGPPRAERPSLEHQLGPGAAITFAKDERVGLQGNPNYHVAGLERLDEQGRFRVVLDTRCFRLVARVWEGHVVDKPEAKDGAGGMGIMGALAAGPWFAIAKGAVVRWPDGTEAGRRTEGVRTNTPPVRVGALACFDRVFGDAGPKAERTLRVCYDAEDVTEEEGSPLKGILGNDVPRDLLSPAP